jgi:tetratricopeptide (TPR) repeat protein
MFRASLFSLFFIFTLSAKGMPPVLVEDIDRQYESVPKTAEDLLQTESTILKALKQSGVSEPLTWRLARTYYSLGDRSTEDVRKEYYHRCIERADQAIQLNNQSAWGFFLRGICRGKLGEMQGIWSSLSIIKPLKQDFKKAVKLDPSVSAGGPHRALGKLYLELPGLLGGSVNKSVDHLKQAVTLGPTFADNYLFLADALFEQENYQAAKITLGNLLTIVPKSDDSPKAQQIRKKVQTRMEKIDPWIESQASHAQ